MMVRGTLTVVLAKYQAKPFSNLMGLMLVKEHKVTGKNQSLGEGLCGGLC